MAPDLTVVDHLPSTSQEALFVWIGAFADPTGSSISYAFIPASQVEPAADAYTAGSWVSDPINPNIPPLAGTAATPPQKGKYQARLPQGPGSAWPLTPGTHYEVYVKLGLDGSVHRAGVVRTL
jgi:hypothetical protein